MLPLFALFTLPDATTTLTGVADYSGSMFTELLPISYMIVGFIVGGLIVSVVIRAILNGVKKVAGGKRGGRRRR